MRIIFMGTPEFAVPTLKKLLDSTEHKVASVFTMPPRPKGRGMKTSLSPIDSLSKEYSIDVFTPKSLKNHETQEIIKNIEADIIIVVAYGMIIPKEILYSKKYGCINLHPSKLPRFRGAAPLEYTILNGDKDTQICTMQMDEHLDTGDILLSESLLLDSKITLSELSYKASHIGAELVLKTINNIDNIVPRKQSKENIVYANKIKKEDGVINWERDDVNQIDRMLRALGSRSGVFFDYNGEMIKLISADYINDYDRSLKPGTILDNFTIVTKKGILKPLIIQKPSKKPITREDFLNSQ